MILSMVGTGVWSILFWLAAIISTIIISVVCYQMFEDGYKKSVMAQLEKRPSRWIFAKTLIKIISLIVLLIISLTVGYNMMQSVTTNSSDYKNQNELKEQKRVSETVAPTTATADANKKALDNRAEVKKHEEAVETFEQKMKRETDKINERNK